MLATSPGLLVTVGLCGDMLVCRDQQQTRKAYHIIMMHAYDMHLHKCRQRQSSQLLPITIQGYKACLVTVCTRQHEDISPKVTEKTEVSLTVMSA
jgi:hypothetical protein